ncbi:hypothetical protein BJ944DRAFT_48034 [Cunninghamella echinulata]|nr:hypothetical protein BJ944DRAFT_48034 [Cunninghamella echinulata]
MAKLTPDSPSLSITSSTTSTTTTSNTSSSPKNTLSSLPPLSITTHLPPTNKEDEQAKETELLRRIYSTSLGFQAWIEKLNKRSPINLRLFTVPFCKATVKRISSLESFYAQSSIIRFLLRKGFPPVLLFLSTTSGMVWFLKRFYLRNKYLAINCLGVLYPTWRCWQLVKRLDTHGEPMEQIKECKSWLAYWMVYGSLQGIKKEK